MINIIVKGDLDFGLSIRELLRVWGEILNNIHEEIVIDLSACRFCNCCLLLGLYLLQKKLSKEGVRISININCGNSAFASYLELTSFKNSLNPDTLSVDEMEAKFNYYRDRTYLPLLDFPVADNQTDIREKLLSFLTQNIHSKLTLDPQMKSVVSYQITEAVNNICDHSHASRGYLFLQYYPRKKLMDIAIADMGVSLLGSYIMNGHEGVKNHVEAMQSALNGESTKLEKNRGFGIRTSRNMLVQGLEGRYFMMSGNAFLNSRPGIEDSIGVFPEKPGIQWNGTFIALRVPVNTKPGFDYTKYLE
jgi:hypothetical protein